MIFKLEYTIGQYLITFTRMLIRNKYEEEEMDKQKVEDVGTY
jgi:hypothetical protein